MKKYFLFLFFSLSFVGFCQNREGLSEAVNTVYNELSPFIVRDGRTLYFSRKNHPQNRYGEKGSEDFKGSQDIWATEFSHGKWNQSYRVSNELNLTQFNALLGLTDDGMTGLIKGFYEGVTYKGRGFSLIKKINGQWQMPEGLNIEKLNKYNKGAYEHGTISADGETIILSLSTSKKGDDDLFVIFKNEDGTWTEPLDLGENINTEDNETTAFLSNDTKILYFSSDRKGGLGSNDIWMSKRLDDSWELWSKPTNMGSKVNTEGYDAYFSITKDEEWAYMMVQKDPKQKGDIVQIKLDKKEIQKTIPTIAQKKDKENTVASVSSSINKITPKTIKKPNTNNTKITTSDNIMVVTGKVIDSKNGTVPNDAVVIFENLENGKILGSIKPNPETGEYKIILPYGKKYGITARAEGFIAVSENYDLSEKKTGYLEVKDKNLSLVAIEKGETVRLNNIFFEFGKTNLRKESYPELDRIVDLMFQNKNLVIEIGGHSDNVGTDEINNKISAERANSVRIYLIRQQISSKRITSKGYGKTKSIANNDTEEGRQQNRRVEFTVLKN